MDVERARSGQQQQQDAHRRLLTADLAHDPLNSTLDLSRVEDLEGRTAPAASTTRREELEEEETLSGKVLGRLSMKEVPDVGIFSGAMKESGKGKKRGKKQVKEEAGGDRSAGGGFLSPYLRYKMLKPYLKFVREKEGQPGEGDGEEGNKHAEQVRSIREHFDALTAMTADDFAGEGAKEEEKVEVAEDEEVEVEEEEEVDPGPVKPLRAGMATDRRNFIKKRKKQLKGKSEKMPKMEPKKDGGVGGNGSAPAAALDYEAADFGQFKKGRGGGKDRKRGAYDPWRGFNKKGRGGRKQRFKSEGRSMSYM